MSDSINSVPVPAVPQEPRALIALEIGARAQMIKQLGASITTNQYGLPESLYRSDLLPPFETWQESDSTAQYQLAQAALIELDYSQGYACFPNGDSIWAQMPHEGADEYRAFQHFLEMPRVDADGHRPSAPVRQLNLLKPITGMDSTALLSLSYQYYWPERARAYDLFRIASHVRQKELRTQSVEDTHFIRAQKYIDYAETFLEGVFSDPEHFELTPKEAFDMMHKMMQMQRLSVGLSPNGAHAGKDENRTPANAPLELILRTIARNAGVADSDSKNAGQLTQELMKDPEALMQAQELIIRMGNIQSPRGGKTSNHFEDD